MQTKVKTITVFYVTRTNEGTCIIQASEVHHQDYENYADSYDTSAEDAIKRSLKGSKQQIENLQSGIEREKRFVESLEKLAKGE